MKTCTKCLASKNDAEFYKTRKGALYAACKECTKKAVMAHYSSNRERYREYERRRNGLEHRVAARAEYAKTAAGQAAKRRATKKYCEKYPVKRAAHIICRNAIRDGRLNREGCEVCGASQAEAHHDDYTKPLDVRWLCKAHHVEWHRHNKAKYD